MTTFTRSHAIVAYGKQAQVRQEGGFLEVQAGNEYAELILSFDRPAAEHLYRALRVLLYSKTRRRLPDHHMEAYQPGAGL